jgi:cell wall-associated NlpC family hydrolase
MTPTEMAGFVREQQELHPGEEVCGFFVKCNDGIEHIPARNVSLDRTLGAIPDRDSVRKATDAGIAYAYHTHLDDSEPGTCDQAYCDAAGVPYLIVAPTSCTVLSPTPPWKELLGIGWEYGKADCVTLVWEFLWTVMGLELGARPQIAEEDFPPAYDFYHAVHEELGFVAHALDDVQLRYGDVLSFRLMAPVGPDGKKHENHVGIYVGDSTMVHRPFGGSSEATDLGTQWLSRVAWVYRHQSIEASG